MQSLGKGREIFLNDLGPRSIFTFREDLKSSLSCHFLLYNVVMNLNTTLEHFSGK